MISNRFLFVILATGLFFSACSKKGQETPAAKAGVESKSKPGAKKSSGALPEGYNTSERGLPIAPRDVPLLEQLNREYIKIAEAVLPGVVNIFAVKPLVPGITFGDETIIIPFPNIPQKPPSKNGRRNSPAPKDNSMGSGVIISREGHIITNGHVVKDADEITVQLYNNRRVLAKMIAYDEPSDLAVLKIDVKEVLHPMVWGDSSTVRIGEQVIAIGNPFGLSESISNGIVSAIGRNPGFGPNSYEDFIQTTAAINPGNSGGALVNIHGELIGINTAIASTNRGFQGIAFALPSNLARFVVESLLRHGKVVRGYLGVTIQEIKPDLQVAFGLTTDEGSLVTEVAANSPAAIGGIERGDVITQYNGRSVLDPAQLRLAVSQTQIGSDVKVNIIRQGKDAVVTLKVVELPPEASAGSDLLGSVPPRTNPKLNQVPVPPPDVASNIRQTVPQPMDNVLAAITVANIDEATRKRLGLTPDFKAVAVVRVEPDSIADAHGVQIGDMISEVRIKGESTVEKLNDVKSFLLAAKKVKPTQDVVLLIRRGKGTNFVLLPANPK